MYGPTTRRNLTAQAAKRLGLGDCAPRPNQNRLGYIRPRGTIGVESTAANVSSTRGGQSQVGNSLYHAAA